MDLLGGDVYTASAQALSTVTALAVPARSCRDLLEAEPRCLLRFAFDLAEIVAVLTGSVADLVFLDLERRLGRLLADSPSVGDSVHLAMTQSELAARLGVARQSLNRAFAKLAERGLIVVESSRVVRVVDRLALGAFIDSGPR